MRNGIERPHRALVGAKRAPGVLGRVSAWSGALARQTRQRPARTVALALGAGFVLGGGLFSPLTARVMGLGVRLGVRMALPIVAQRLSALIGDMSRNQEQETHV